MSDNEILFGKVIKMGRKAAGMSQKDLADRLRVTRNTVINWESDRSRPDYSLVPELCSVLGIHLAELFGIGDGSGSAHFSVPDGISVPDDAERRVISDFRMLSPSGRRIAVRLLDTMVEEETAARDDALKEQFRLFTFEPGSAAAGPGNEIPEEPPTYGFLRMNDRNERADAVVRVSGASMEPVYYDGDEVYIQYTSAAHPGEDVICSTADGAVIKRVSPDHTLYSVNAGLPYGTKHEDDNVTVLGRVLGAVSSSDRPGTDDLPLLEELFAEDIREFTAKYRPDF